MKIHRVVQMLGATTTTGKLASDMYDLNYKTYYSEAEGRDVPISHMDFQHMVRAFVKQNEKTDNDFSRSMNLRNHLQEENEKLEMENQRLVQRLEHDETVVSKEAYQVMWDNCEKLKEDLKKTDDIVENNDKIYKKNLQEQEDKVLALSSKITNLLSIIEEKQELLDQSETLAHRESKHVEYWRKLYYNECSLQGKGYVFSEIPNDTDGQEFLDKLKKHFNRTSYKMRVRGQHIKPELKGTGATYWGQNLDESTHMRIYIEAKKGD